jgi:hypothetical protein
MVGIVGADKLVPQGFSRRHLLSKGAGGVGGLVRYPSAKPGASLSGLGYLAKDLHGIAPVVFFRPVDLLLD